MHFIFNTHLLLLGSFRFLKVDLMVLCEEFKACRMFLQQFFNALCVL